MKRYVLVFAHRVPVCIQQYLVLIERQKADWQQGRLNLPGGHIEHGESAQQAASRELLEETSLYCPAPDIKVLGQINGPDWTVDVCFAPYREWHNGGPQKAKQIEDQPVHEMYFREALTDERLMPNLKIILPLCMAQVSGWTLNYVSDTVWDLVL